MDTAYHSSYIRYERTNTGKVMPVAIRKEWIGVNPKRFAIVDIRSRGYADISRADTSALEIASKPFAKPTTRTELLALGIVREAGHGEPCFTLVP